MTGCRFVKDLCRATKFARSTYYSGLDHERPQREIADATRLEDIRAIDEHSRSTYGATRVWGQLRHHEHRVGRHRVATDGERRTVGVYGRKKWHRGRRDVAPAPDLLERDFSASRPDKRWVADVSEFHCLDGKLFLAGIRDLFDRRLPGWPMNERQSTDLMVSALVTALSRRRPAGNLVHHSDKGSVSTRVWSLRTAAPTGGSRPLESTGDACDNAERRHGELPGPR